MEILTIIIIAALILILLIKNILLIFFLEISILIIFYIKKISLKLLWEKINQLSIFCISIFFSYVFIAILEANQSLIYIYSANAVIVILKVIDILMLNILIKHYKFKINNDFFYFISNQFPLLENLLFDILNKYKSNFEKIKNIHNIISEFFVLSIKKIK